MREFWDKFLQIWRTFVRVFLNPPTWVKALTYLLAVLCSVGSLLILLINFTGTIWEIFAYVLFGVAALSLGYAVYLTIPLIPRIKKWVINKGESWNFTHSLMRNYSFRTIVFAFFSFLMSIAFGVLNGYKGIALQSIWFGALAAYYVFLALLRGGVLIHKRRRGENDELSNAKTYRNCGIILLVLNAALSSAIAQMIFDNQAFSYADWTIFAYAAYAFFKITMSIINLFRAKKQDDLIIMAIRNVNFIDAAVSILALQTALLHTFTTGDVDISLFNTLTGIAVSTVSISLAVLMTRKGYKQTKELKRNYQHEQTV